MLVSVLQSSGKLNDVMLLLLADPEGVQSVMFVGAQWMGDRKHNLINPYISNLKMAAQQLTDMMQWTYSNCLGNAKLPDSSDANQYTTLVTRNTVLVLTSPLCIYSNQDIE